MGAPHNSQVMIRNNSSRTLTFQQCTSSTGDWASGAKPPTTIPPQTSAYIEIDTCDLSPDGSGATFIYTSQDSYFGQATFRFSFACRIGLSNQAATSVTDPASSSFLWNTNFNSGGNPLVVTVVIMDSQGVSIKSQ